MFNILVVEDNKNLRKLMVTYLKRNNYETLEAENGEDALEVLDKNHIDLLISDIMMEKMDGYELTKELRRANYSLPILLITAKETIEDKKNGFLSGADDYMVKPINMDEMILRTGALLKRSNIINQKKIVINDIILSYDEYTLTTKNEVYQLPQNLNQYMILKNLQ